MKGIDVSSYQKTIDWTKVKNSGISFAILKIIRKDLAIDNQFLSNSTGCNLNNIPFSIYNYTYALTREKSKIDANAVVEMIKKYNIDGMKNFKKEVWMDVEHETQMGLGHTLIDIVKEYQDVIESNGYKFGVYTGLSFYNTEFSKYCKELDCPFWIARYPSKANMLFTQNPNDLKKPVIKNNLWGWQYTSYGIIDGIKGNVDFNICYEDENSVDNKNGISTFSLVKEGSQSISKNFKVKEFRCKDGSDKILIDIDFVKDKLQKIRDHFGVPVTINSAYRTVSWNTKCGGAKNSYHLKGMAFDIVVKGKTPQEVAKYAQSLGINCIIKYNTFVHIDSRETKYWAINNNGKVSSVSQF